MKLARIAPAVFALAACANPSHRADLHAIQADDTPPPATTYDAALRAASWAELAAAPKVQAGKQDDIWFTSPMRGFAVSGPASSIYRTNDGGQTWATVETHAGTYFRSILFADDDHGFASNLGPIDGTGITDPTVLYETKNGGDSWAPVTNIQGPAPTGICNQYRIDPTHLVAVGRVTGPSFLMTSADAGQSWTSKDLSQSLQMLIDARFTSPTDGIVIGGSVGDTMRCTILHTSDGGDTFTPVFTSTTDNSLCWKISFPSDEVGYVSVQDQDTGPGTFAKTTDGGKTWIEKPLVGDAYPAIGVGFATDTIGWISPDDPTLPTYKTVDGGETWTPDPVLKSPINRFRFVDKATAYAIGGSVYKLSIAWNAP